MKVQNRIETDAPHPGQVTAAKHVHMNVLLSFPSDSDTLSFEEKYPYSDSLMHSIRVLPERRDCGYAFHLDNQSQRPI